MQNIIQKPITRNYDLSNEQILSLKEEWAKTGKVPCPYLRLGPYKAIVQSLIQLGPDEWHSFVKVRDTIKDIMEKTVVAATGKNVWDTFVNKSSRNAHSGKDVTGRIIQNALILQRITGIHCYGKKLESLGISIHVKKDNGIIQFMLNTKTPIPFNGL